MKRLHVIGRKNHGKTTLVTELLAEYARQGLRVGAVKHTHHDHELDVPGKDSYRHRQAGAAVVGVLSRSMSALFFPSPEPSQADDRYAVLSPAFHDCDLVLVEGDTQANAPKIEVWRSAQGTPPIASDDPTVLALVTDDSSPLAVPTLPRKDVPGLASWILQALS